MDQDPDRAVFFSVHKPFLRLTTGYQDNGTATHCIAVDLVETLRTQSGGYDASKTIDEQDIRHITGVLYAGRVIP